MPILTIAQVRRRVEWLVVTRLVAIGALVGGVVFAAVLSHGPTDYNDVMYVPTTVDVLRNGLPGFVSTGILIATALWLTLRNTRPTRYAFVFTMGAAVLNTPLYVIVSGIGGSLVGGSFGRDPGTVFAMAMVAMLFGLVFTIPFGLPYATLHHLAVLRLVEARVAPTQELLGRARFGVLAITAAGVLALGLLGLFSSLARPIAVGAAWLVLGLAAYDLTVAILVTVRRRRWLAALRRDGVAGHRLVPSAECTVRADIAPLEAVGDDALAVVAAPPGAPYRERPEALMLVPRA